MFVINSGINLFLTIVVLIYMVSESESESITFCEQKGADHVFSFNKTIHLIRGKYYYLSREEGSDLTVTRPEDVNSRFIDLGIHQLVTGFMVTSIPQPCNVKDRNVTVQKKCIFNSFMLNTGFIFYTKPSGIAQVFTMVKFRPNQYSYGFYADIGGFAYGLRANQSVFLSSWPGITNQFNPKMEILSAFYEESEHKLYLFLREKGVQHSSDVRMVVKSLDKEWDVKETTKKVVGLWADTFAGVFKRQGQNYYMEKVGTIHTITKLDPWSTGEKFDAKKFFKCK